MAKTPAKRSAVTPGPTCKLEAAGDGLRSGHAGGSSRTVLRCSSDIAGHTACVAQLLALSLSSTARSHSRPSTNAAPLTGSTSNFLSSLSRS